MLRHSRHQLVFVILLNEATDVNLFVYSRWRVETYMLSLSSPQSQPLQRLEVTATLGLPTWNLVAFISNL